MKKIEVEGRTVTMAVEKGLAELGLRRDQVEVQVLQEANPGFLGIGAKQARVRITEKLWGEESRPSGAPARPRGSRPEEAAAGHRAAEHGRAHGAPRSSSRPGRPVVPPRREEAPSYHRSETRHSERYGSRPQKAPQLAPPPDIGKACEAAKEWLAEFLPALGATFKGIACEWDAQQLRVRAEVDTPDAESLIGKDGRVLEALQFLTTLVVSRRIKTPVAIQVETNDYWKQREESVLTQVHMGIEEVKRTGKPVRLQPMDASLRRMVHRSLASSPDVETVSEGEGAWRKVVLRPKRR